MRSRFLSLTFSCVHLFISVSLASAATSNSENVSVRIQRARDLVLKGERISAVKVFKEIASESPPNSKNAREVLQAWREAAEVFFTDKGQNQESLAESFWMARPKDATEILLPVLKTEDSNLIVARLGARAALRSADCAKAEPFVAAAERVFPNGADVKLLRLQIQDCLGGTSAAAPSLKIPSPHTSGAVDPEWTELEAVLKQLAVRDAYRRKDLKAVKASLSSWEAQASLGASEDPEFWYLKWKTSPEASRDRSAGSKYVRLCSELTPRRRKKFAQYPELCVHTESVEFELRTSEKSGS